jgi:type III pantothenate kinase
MHLVIDIGNTRAKFACFEGKEMVFYGHCDRNMMEQIPNLVSEYNLVSAAICANTSQIHPGLSETLEALPYFVKLSHNTAVPVKIDYHSPNTLGMDRLAAAVGVFRRFPDQNSLVIDMGTCITMDFVESGGTFKGGNISPGIQIRLEAMHHFTSTLPLADAILPSGLLGTSTITAIQQGGVAGACREIDAFIVEATDAFGIVNVILTGGDAHIFESYTKKQIFVLPYLVMEGLNEILHYNVSKK